MNIIFISTSGSISGGARQALYLAKALQGVGHSVVFFTYPGSALRSVDSSIEWLDLPRDIFEANRALRAAMRDDEKNVVHAFHNKAVKIVAFWGSIWLLQKLPVVCVAHRGVNARPKNPLPYLVSGIKAFIVNSKACARVLPLLWRRKRCHVVYNSVPEERLVCTKTASQMRQELDIAENTFVIGNICNDNPLKGAGTLIEAYAKAKKSLPPTVLLIVGASAERWLALCKNLGVENEVRFIRTQFVADYLQIVDLFVFTSQFIESQPNVLLEAMSMGLPIIANKVGGVPEILEAPYLFDSRKLDKVAQKIVEFAKDKQKLAQIGKENKAKSTIFATEHRLEKVLKIYGDALKEIGL